MLHEEHFDVAIEFPDQIHRVLVGDGVPSAAALVLAVPVVARLVRLADVCDLPGAGFQFDGHLLAAPAADEQALEPAVALPGREAAAGPVRQSALSLGEGGVVDQLRVHALLGDPLLGPAVADGQLLLVLVPAEDFFLDPDHPTADDLLPVGLARPVVREPAQVARILEGRLDLHVGERPAVDAVALAVQPDGQLARGDGLAGEGAESLL